MKFSQEVERRVMAALAERFPEKRIVCPLCKHENWVLSNGFFLLPLQERSDVMKLQGGRAIIAIGLSCTNCGNTHFLNLLNLGLGDLFKDQPYTDDDIEVRL